MRTTPEKPPIEAVLIETWLPITGYEGRYEVSDQGRVRSLRARKTKRKRILKPYPVGCGHMVVTLGHSHKRYVHQLVLEEFVGPRPPGMETSHKNDIPSDNRLVNLEWATRLDNMLNRIKTKGRLHGYRKAPH